MVEYIKLVYNEQLRRYLRQEEWLGINYARAKPEHLAAFKECLADLGEIGYLLEKDYRVEISLEEKLNGFEVSGKNFRQSDNMLREEKIKAAKDHIPES